MQNKSYSLIELEELFPQLKFVIKSEKNIKDVSILSEATENDITFFASEKYRKDLNNSKAGLICIKPGEELKSNQSYVITEKPSDVFYEFTKLFRKNNYSTIFTSKISSSAVLAPNVEIGKDVTIYPNVVVDEDCVIGDGVVIYPNTFIGKGVVIGNGSIIYSNVTLREHTVIGNTVIIQAGAVIGSCGFGYNTSKDYKHKKIDQLGSVVIEDDVEIGANTTIDRARIASTIIGKGTKIDNLVQIGHNVKMGKDCLIVSQVGIAGSVEIGDRVTLGGQVGVVGHISITSNVTVMAKSAITKKVSKPGVYGGLMGLMPSSKFLKTQVCYNNLMSFFKKFRET